MNLIILALGRWAKRKLWSLRFILLVLPWVAVTAVPELRTMLSVQVVGSPLNIGPGASTYPWTPGAYRDEGYDEGDWAFSAQRLATLYPDDAAAQVMALKLETDSRPTRQGAWLLQHHSDKPWVLAALLSDFRFKYTRSLTGKTPAKLKLREAHRQWALGVARRGQQVEPNNAYFDCMEMLCLFFGNRPAEAMESLTHGASKPYFSSHLRERGRAQLAVSERVRPLLIEEKQTLYDELYYHYTAAFASSQDILSESRLLRQRGERQGELQAIADWLAILDMMEANGEHKNFTAVRKKVSLWGRVLEKTEFALPAGTSGYGSAAHAITVAQRFAAYTRKYGRPDLADKALREASDFARLEELDGRESWLKGVSEATASQIFTSWLVAQMAGIAWLALVLWRLVLDAIIWSPGLNRSSPNMGPRRSLAVAYVTTTAALLVFILHTDAWRYATWNNFLSWALAYALPICVLAGPVVCALTTLWRSRSEFFGKRSVTTDASGTVLPHSVLPAFVKVMGRVLLAMTSALWLIAGIASANDGIMTLPIPPVLQSPGGSILDVNTESAATIAAGLTLLYYLSWLIRWRYFAVAPLKLATHESLNWHRKSLGDAIVVLGFAYLYVALAALPPRREADAAMDQFLKHRTVASTAARQGR